jgi:hypothetical protein
MKRRILALTFALAALAAAAGIAEARTARSIEWGAPAVTESVSWGHRR